MTDVELGAGEQGLCSPPTNYPWTAPVYAEVRRATETARNQICKPYVWGASGPGSFDCSGLVYYAYRQAGFNVSRTTAQGLFDAQMYSSGGPWGSIVGYWERRPGDLLYFSTGCNTTTITHVAIYLGVNRDNGKEEVVHALNPSSGVVLSQLGSFGLCLNTTYVGRVKY
ncbi:MULTISPECIES: C40 family peptidase [Myxococcus]|uniref:C40 family peptidase n=1 Tax=Myxococcus TaxID=32 RepID=UPI0018913CE7|nr:MULTISPECIES: C40 family peptidase [Myxococcus]